MNRTTAISLCAALVLATVAIYLGAELGESRSALQDATARTQALQARVAELEARKFAGNRTSGRGFTARPVAGAASAAFSSESQALEANPVSSASSANASPVTRRYLRAQAGSNAKRLYTDFVNEQGLSTDEARALYDLVASHEMALSTASPGTQAAEDPQSLDRDLATAATRLLGETRGNEFENYRQTLGMRFEVAALADQLEGANAPMTDEQRRSLLRSITSDRNQWQPPTFAPGQTLEQAQRTYSDWQESQSARFASLVRSTLTPEQVKHFDDFESARRELRDGN